MVRFRVLSKNRGVHKHHSRVKKCPAPLAVAGYTGVLTPVYPFPCRLITTKSPYILLPLFFCLCCGSTPVPKPWFSIRYAAYFLYGNQKCTRSLSAQRTGGFVETAVIGIGS